MKNFQSEEDPIVIEVMRNAFQSVAEEMGVALVRTALSTNIKDRRDCSTGIYTEEGELVAQAEHIPLHLGLMPAVVKSVLEHFPADNLREGEAIIINDPYISGSHLPDVCVITPVFYQGEIIAIAANLAHHVDMGGISPGSMSATATEIFQEGIRIPPLKILKSGKINKDIMDLISHNVRTSGEFWGDIYAQLAANNVGAGRFLELVQKYGAQNIKKHMEALIKYTERRLRERLKILPCGVYSFCDYLEGDGIKEEKIKIEVQLKIRRDLLKVDFTGTADQVEGPVNCTRPVALACVFFVVKSVVDPCIPSNEGISRLLEVITPEGSLVNPRFPAAVANANINTAQRVADVILGAFAQAVPERVTAASTGSMSLFTIGGIDTRKEKYYSYVETYGGGQGAKVDQDGMDGIHTNMTNTRNAPVEVMEREYPLRVEKYSLRPGTGGAGKFRGGMGLRREITVLGEKSIVSLNTERKKILPWGLNGGKRAKGSLCLIQAPGDLAPRELASKVTQKVYFGTKITLCTAGGGGFGNPLERDPLSVREDVLNGLVTKEKAREDYGVVFKKGSGGLEIDFEATAELRERKMKKT